MKQFEIYLFLSLKHCVCIDFSGSLSFQCYFICLFFFRQKKLEKVMEEEGLKDEEVINIGKTTLKPWMAVIFWPGNC